MRLEFSLTRNKYLHWILWDQKEERQERIIPILALELGEQSAWYRQRQWNQQSHGSINNYSELEKSQVVQLIDIHICN